MTTCRAGGYLVDGTHAIPDDPTELDVEGLPVVGCSRLRCRSCGQPVRSAAGLAFAARGDAPLAEVYGAPALESSPLLVRDRPSVRLYLCRCARWLETARHACEVTDRDASDPDVPWRCSGHPTISLPHELDGIVVRSPDDLRDVVARGFRGQPPPRTRAGDVRRADWIARLRARLAGPAAAAVVEVALACLDDQAPDVRARALRFFYVSPAEPGQARVLDLLARRRDLLAGVPDPVTAIEVDTTLEHSAWRVVAPLVGRPGPAREQARADALAGRANVALYDAIAQHDASWLTEHAAELARAAPARVNELLDSLSQLPDHVPARGLRDQIRAAVRPA